MTLTTEERTRYEDLWTGVPAYADESPGERYVPLFLQVTGAARGHVLDAGCGCGKGAVALHQQGFRLTLADLTNAGLVDEAQDFPFHDVCLWHNLKGLAPLGAFDWVYCCDVMEHLPTAFTMLAVEQMLRITRRSLFLGVALTPDQYGGFVGHPLHQTVESFVWWRDALREVGTVIDARDLVSTGIYVVEPGR